MEEYLFEGEIQGQYRTLQIYPKSEVPNQYLVHWDGFEVGIIKKEEGKWQSEDAALKDAVPEIGAFIDKYEEKINKEG